MDIGVELGQGYLLARPGPAWPQVAGQAIAICHEGPREAVDGNRVTVLADARDKRHSRL